MIREMEQLTPSTPEDFLFKGYAEAYLEPELGLQSIQEGTGPKGRRRFEALYRTPAHTSGSCGLSLDVFPRSG
jgi:hypothetical protein